MGKKLILIVDDDNRGRKLFRDFLEAQGYATITATDGAQAIAVARNNHPDLILMDIQLPGMDGVTAMHELKDNPATKEIPIIAVTAYAMRGDENRLLQSGFNDFIAKPVDIHALLTKIQSHLHKGARDG